MEKNQKGSALIVIIVVTVLTVALFAGGFAAKYYFSQPVVNNKVGPLAQEEITTSTESAETDQSLVKELVPTPTPTPIPTKVPTKAPVSSSNSNSSGSLNASAEAREGGALVKWTGDSSNGFKVCASENANPSYPGDNCIYKSAGERSLEFGGLTAGKTYHFRVGVYGTDGKVNSYSNDVTAVPTGSSSSSNASSGQVKSISMNVEKQDGGKAKVTWSVDGNSPLGFKVVWGPNSGPTYPTKEGDKYHYYSDAGKRDDIIDNLSGRTYYFRVCEYLGGKCGVYSNEVSLSY